MEFIHSKLAWGAIGLAVLHAGAALKHQFVDKDGVLARMIPGLKAPGESIPAAPGRALMLAGGFAAIAVAATAALWLFEHPPTGASEAPASVVHSHDEAHDTGEAEPTDELAAEASAPHADDGHTHAVPHSPQGVSIWQVIHAESSLAFTGVHAGVPFEGRFGSWRADIRFDPSNLDQSSAVVTINIGSATDGVPLHDQSLPGEEWFDTARHPTATFRTTSIRARGDGAYEARGTLTIKDRPIDISLPFTLRIDGDRAVMDGTARIDRREADLGMASDPDAEYVSREIGVRVHVEATRAP